MVSLYDHQRSALEKMKNGCILCGGVGSGKSRTALAYYYLQQGGNLDIPDAPMKNPLDIYIITTARKRDTCEWENELAPFLLSTHEDCNYYKNKVVIDSWNNISKYKDVKNSFFIFDEQRVVGYSYIQSIQLTQGNHTPGSTDIYTVTMTDGSKYNIAVYNGLNGTGTGDVLGIHFDLVLPASGWSNGSITVAESRLVAAAKYKYLIDAYEASREEYLECNVRPKDISTTGFITFVNDTDPIKDITVNIVRLELSVNAEEGGE